MNSKFVLFSVYYDKEEFRRQLINFEENGIVHKANLKEVPRSFKSPLSGIFEAEILVSEDDFSRAKDQTVGK